MAVPRRCHRQAKIGRHIYRVGGARLEDATVRVTAGFLRPPEWVRRAACAPYVADGNDWWHADDELPARERNRLFEQGRAVCTACPVQVQCARFGLELLTDEVRVFAVYGGMTPLELRRVAKAIGRPAHKTARHGTRSMYVTGCRCRACRTANQTYEHGRRVAMRRQRRECQARKENGFVCLKATEPGSVFCKEHALPAYDDELLLLG